MNIKHVYVSCLGTVYLSSERGLERVRCSQCGDHDEYLDTVSSAKELRELLLSEQYDNDYIEEVVQRAVEYDGIPE